jgi:hypothetical protein
LYERAPIIRYFPPPQPEALSEDDVAAIVEDMLAASGSSGAERGAKDLIIQPLIRLLIQLSI